MIDSIPRRLDFALLDDVLMAVENGLCTADLPLCAPDMIGPLVELAVFTQSASALSMDRLLLESPVGRALERVLISPAVGGNGLSLQPDQFEFARLPYDGMTGLPQWIAFRKRLESAGVQAGLSRRIATGLTGAFCELTENVLVHSDNPTSGVCGYQFCRGTFEFVVADTGIGVLGSLKKCRDYDHLSDEGAALQTALADGESRFGRGSGRGWGYHQLFASLANQRGNLRFRSGDHSLELDEVSPSLVQAQISQRAMLQGFVSSIVCRV